MGQKTDQELINKKKNYFHPDSFAVQAELRL